VRVENGSEKEEDKILQSVAAEQSEYECVRWPVHFPRFRELPTCCCCRSDDDMTDCFRWIPFPGSWSVPGGPVAVIITLLDRVGNGSRPLTNCVNSSVKRQRANVSC